MKSNDLIKKVVKEGVISEREMLLLKRRLNNGEEIDLELFYHQDIELTKEHTEKGIKWLRNKFRTPKGKERKNHPFGLREQFVIDNFSKLYLIGYYDASRHFSVKNYQPLYYVESTDNTHFEYTVANGEVYILG